MIIFATIIQVFKGGKLFKWGNYSIKETIQRKKLFKGGNYYQLGGFNQGNYSKEETIQGRKLYEEIR
jgi:hypothetical protein